jgi:hypothetical protein
MNPNFESIEPGPPEGGTPNGGTTDDFLRRKHVIYT